MDECARAARCEKWNWNQHAIRFFNLTKNSFSIIFLTQFSLSFKTKIICQVLRPPIKKLIYLSERDLSTKLFFFLFAVQTKWVQRIHINKTKHWMMERHGDCEWKLAGQAKRNSTLPSGLCFCNHQNHLLCSMHLAKLIKLCYFDENRTSKTKKKTMLILPFDHFNYKTKHSRFVNSTQFLFSKILFKLQFCMI